MQNAGAAVSSSRRKHVESYNFSVLAKQEAKEGIAKDISDLLTACPPQKKEEFSNHLNSFKEIFSRFIDEDEKKLSWSEIEAPSPESIRPYTDLIIPEAGKKEMLDKLVVLKLNGELQIGGTGPKSLITVRDGSTFLDMQVQQIEHLNDEYGCNIPLVFMNSVNTHGHEDLQKVLRKYSSINVSLFSFQQSIYPRIYKESLRTVPRSVEEGVVRSKEDGGVEMWYSPGHGDFYQSFYNSGLLQKFIEEGKEYIFVSNIDNLRATVDLSILNHLLSQPEDARCEFLMEVTEKSGADVKGGSIIKYCNNIRLLETAQVPKIHAEDFKSSSRFKFFNTNNLWIELGAIKRAVESHSLRMDIIAHHMQLEDGNKIIQLQTAVGGAIRHFNHHKCINVPRFRFLPMKSCSDLFLILSNLYHVKDGTLSMSSQRQFPTTPIVKLGKYFDKIGDFMSRFGSIPNIIDLDHLTVAGDVTFGKNVVLKGTVIIIANHGERIDIPPGALLENKIVSGNLRLIDH